MKHTIKFKKKKNTTLNLIKQLDSNKSTQTKNIPFTLFEEDYQWDEFIYKEYEKVDEYKASADLFIVNFEHEELECLLIFDKTGAEVLMQKPLSINKNNINQYGNCLFELKKFLLKSFFQKHNFSIAFKLIGSLPQIAITQDKYLIF